MKSIRKIAHPVLKLWLKLYYIRPRKYSYKGVTVIVHRAVFPPYLTISTNIFIEFLEGQSLYEKKVLELGCGSGLISLYAAKNGAIVTASDINPKALDYLKKSAQLNKLPVNICFSDLFENLPQNDFDFMLINPPYYPRKPKDIREQAWFCGEDFEYFKKLFQQLPTQLSNANHCYMILSDACQLETIYQLAKNEKLKMQMIYTQKASGEENYIFEICRDFLS